MLCMLVGLHKGTAFQAPRALEWEAGFPGGWVLLRVVLLGFSKLVRIGTTGCSSEELLCNLS